MENWGLTGLFAASFMSATILPFSSEAIFLWMLSAGHHPVACLAAATLGNGLGGMTNYGIGRLGNPAWMKRLGASDTGLQKYALRVERYGAYAAFFSWVPFIGDPLVVALGFFRSPLVATMCWLWTGKFLRYLVVWGVYAYFSS